jgi:hypothetical protein
MTDSSYASAMVTPVATGDPSYPLELMVMGPKAGRRALDVMLSIDRDGDFKVVAIDREQIDIVLTEKQAEVVRNKGTLLIPLDGGNA